MFKFKCLYFAAIISLASNLAIASETESDKLVRFPTKEVLRRSLHEADLSHFMEKTKIEDIVDDELVAFGVAVRLEQKLWDYNEYMQHGRQGGQNMIAVMMQMRKNKILEILLQNDQQALEELKDAGLYNPKK